MIYGCLAMALICLGCAVKVIVTARELEKTIQLNSHRIGCLEAEIKENEEKLARIEAMLASLAERLADLESQTEAVQDLKSYNEGISNIMSYSVDVAMGKNK